MNVIRRQLLASLETILVSGGDSRSSIDADTGLNIFGCAPTPRPHTLSFSSSTASTISVSAFEYVEEERRRLLESLIEPDLLDGPMDTIRAEIRALLGLGHEVEIVFSSSGTDSTMHALFLAQALDLTHTPLDSILVVSDETGSGVPQALTGRHFSSVTSEGVPVTPGSPVAGLSENTTLVPLARRRPDGTVRSSMEMDLMVFTAVTRSVAAGRRVLLQVMDSSKLGTRCPTQSCLSEIQDRYGEVVQIVVDACQMRLSPARLQWHLSEGHLVLISGSKFFMGPPFSGALLVPGSLSARFQSVRHVPAGLRDYANRSAWPTAWASIKASLSDRVNLGQYFRWMAALAEMRTYFAIPLEFRRLALCRFASMAAEMIDQYCPAIRLMEGCGPNVEMIDDAEMAVRTIFPIAVQQGEGWLSHEDAAGVYALLNCSVSDRMPAYATSRETELAAKLCHVGQPVRVTLDGRRTAGALRICAGAGTVARIWARSQVDPLALRLDREADEIRTILDKTLMVSSYFTTLREKAA